jgi:uncharacterized protein
MNEYPDNQAQQIRQSQPVEGIKLSADAIRKRAGKFEHKISRRNLREYIASLLAAVGFVYFFAKADDVLFRVTWGVFIAGMGWVVVQLHRKGSARSMPAASGASTCREFFRAELERQRDVVSNIWPWYLAPLIPGFVVYTVAYAVAFPRPASWAGLALLDGIVVALFLLVWKMNRRAARCLQRTIDEFYATITNCDLTPSSARGGANTMKRVLTLVILVIAATVARAQDIGGDWQGTLNAEGAELRLVLHITKVADNSLKATLDSIDQPGANGIPVSSISFKDAKLSLDVATIKGAYAAKLAPDGKTISGTWTQQGQAFPLEFKHATALIKTDHRPAKPSDIDGAWMGTLDTGTIKLRVVFHIVNTEDGLTATMDSLDQGMKGLPTTSVTRDGTTLKIEAKSLGGLYEGKVAADLSSIDGKWSQGGGAMPLVLKRVRDQAELELKRPQNPVKPYPYRNEDVSYDNKLQHVTLAATLTLPQGKGPFPAVVLITGSGPQDRDESLLGHQPFLVLSDYLTRHGIAVLRADDRGTAQSTGDFATATTADFATDTEAGIAYLKTRAEVDPNKIGLIGHSEGGVIAPMIAARNKDVTFIVMMAGTGVPGDQILPAQGEAIQIATGKSPEEAAKGAAKEKEMLTLVETEKDEVVLQKLLREKMAGDVPEPQIGLQIKQVTSPWFRYFLTYDPATALRKVTCPVLAINGSLDKQVLPGQNLPSIRQALQEAGNQHFEVDELPGLNHLFQTARTGSPAEYAQIEETMSPVALDKMATWIRKQ